MTLRKFKFWIQRIQNESSCRSRLPLLLPLLLLLLLFLDREAEVRRGKNRKNFPLHPCNWQRRRLTSCFRALRGGVRATGVNFAVGDYANGVVVVLVVEQEREKTQEWETTSLVRWRVDRGGFSCLSLPRSWLPPTPLLFLASSLLPIADGEHSRIS